MSNFCILLTDDVENCSATIANLPTNEDGVKVIASLSSAESVFVQTSAAFKENDMCALFWMEKEGYVWYLGYITEVINDGEKYKVDHLHPFPTSQKKYPRKKDLHDVLHEQILDVQVHGDWILEDRNRRFVLSNEKEIEYQFKQQLGLNFEW